MHVYSKSSIVLCWLNSCLQICRNKILMTNAWKLYISFAGGVEADGMWQATFVTFLVYAMMPLKTWVAVAFSTLIAVVHMSISGILTANPKIGLHWQQVRPNNFFDAFLWPYCVRCIEEKEFVQQLTCKIFLPTVWFTSMNPKYFLGLK